MDKLPFLPCNLGDTNRLSGQLTKKSCKGKRGDIQKVSLISIWSSLIIGISDDSFCPAPISSIHVGESCRDWTGASIEIMLSFVMYCVDSPIRCIHFSVAENCYPPRLVEL